MNDVEILIEIINDFFGCDAAYFDVNPFDLAMHLISNGVKIDNQKRIYNAIKPELKIEDIIKEMQNKCGGTQND